LSTGGVLGFFWGVLMKKERKRKFPSDDQRTTRRDATECKTEKKMTLAKQREKKKKKTPVWKKKKVIESGWPKAVDLAEKKKKKNQIGRSSGDCGKNGTGGGGNEEPQLQNQTPAVRKRYQTGKGAPP